MVQVREEVGGEAGLASSIVEAGQGETGGGLGDNQPDQAGAGGERKEEIGEVEEDGQDEEIDEDKTLPELVPIPQDDGPNAVVRISYSAEFEEATGLLRAVLHRDERSKRALAITERAIRANPANYTAWQFRRVVLESLGADLYDELDYVAEVAAGGAKNYQLWHHRRWLAGKIGPPARAGELAFTAKVLLGAHAVEDDGDDEEEEDGNDEDELEEGVGDDGGSGDGGDPEKEDEACQIGGELQGRRAVHGVALRRRRRRRKPQKCGGRDEDDADDDDGSEEGEVGGGDAKNYHAWSHRQWVLQELGGWERELNFCDRLLRADVWNNSAWNQRMFVLTRWIIPQQQQRRRQQQMDVLDQQLQSQEVGQQDVHYRGSGPAAPSAAADGSGSAAPGAAGSAGGVAEADPASAGADAAACSCTAVQVEVGGGKPGEDPGGKLRAQALVREFAFTRRAIEKVPANESAWRYLQGLLLLAKKEGGVDDALRAWRSGSDGCSGSSNDDSSRRSSTGACTRSSIEATDGDRSFRKPPPSPPVTPAAAADLCVDVITGVIPAAGGSARHAMSVLLDLVEVGDCDAAVVWERLAGGPKRAVDDSEDKTGRDSSGGSAAAAVPPGGCDEGEGSKKGVEGAVSVSKGMVGSELCRRLQAEDRMRWNYWEMQRRRCLTQA